jgi:tetratricopeptide (TPR) repeat protein/tRNA A-37 threonylcarbamoyl transferase component Bud32
MMVQTTLLDAACPEEETIELVRTGDVSGPPAERVLSHAMGCETCARRLGSLVPTAGGTGDGRGEEQAAAGVLERGTSVGRYMVLERIGEGGMGEVYSAYDPELERKVAIKVIRPETEAQGSDDSGAFRTRLLREAQALARLSHPNVVTVYDVGWLADHRMFLTVELVTGMTLRQWLRVKKRPWRDVLRAYLEAGRGLSAAHGAGLIHRDFKPTNVLVGTDGSVKVTDFGLARAVTALPEVLIHVPAAEPSGPRLLDSPLTEAGAVLGTPGYMAPEQYRSLPTDARSDQFSFCVSLYEGLYGVRPFQGDSLPALSSAVAEGRVGEVPAGSQVPSFIRRILLRGLSAEPSARYATLDALLRELSRDPAAGRKRAALWIGSAAAVAGLMVLVWHAARGHDPVTCTGAQAQMDEVWNGATKQQAEQAFMTTKAAFAADSWRRVRESLDLYATRWVSEQRSACGATRLRGEQPESIMTLRMTCLEQRRNQMRALAHTFGEADRQVVEKSVEAVGSLPSVTDCEDVTSLTTVKPMPSQPEQRAAIDGLRRELASGQVLVDAGKYAAAAALVAPLVERAKAVGYEPLLAEAMLVLGEAQDRSASKAEAAATLRGAAYAADAGRADDTRVRALGQLVHVLVDAFHLDEAHESIDSARAAASRLADPNAYRVELDSDESWLLVAEGKYLEATVKGQSAIAAAERSAETNPIFLARLYSRNAATMAKTSDLERATALLERADALFVKVQGENFPGRVTVQVNKAAMLCDAERGEAALLAVDLGLDIAARALPPESASYPVLYNNRAEALLQLGRFPEGLEAATRATDLARKAFGETSGRTAEMQLNMAKALRLLGRLDEAIASYREVLAILEPKLSPDHTYLFEGHHGLGLALLAMHRVRDSAAVLENVVANPPKGDQSINVKRQKAAAFAELAEALWGAGTHSPRISELVAQSASAYRALGDEAKANAVETWLHRLRP